MDRRLVGIIIILLGLAIAGGLIYFLFFFDFTKVNEALNKTEAPVVNVPAITKPAATSTGPTAQRVVEEYKPPVGPKTVGEADLKQMASLFAERFGSYSNQSNYRNLRDLQMFMTEKLKQWSEDFIKQMIDKKADTSIYFGVSTRSVSVETKDFNAEAGTAKFLVSTHRRESIATGANSAGYGQKLEVIFKKEGGMWKVDEANWLAKE